MPALHATRRHLLSGIAAGMVAPLAGCAAGEADDVDVRDEIRDPGSELPDGATTDIEIRSLRAPAEEPFVRVADEDEPEEEGPSRHRAQAFVLDDGDAAALRIDGDHDAAEEILRFVEATDFESASVVVHQRGIEACYERRVEYVELEPDRYRVQFCRQLKDATEHCEADATEIEAVFLRVPQPYDEEPSRRGSGERSACRHYGEESA